MTISLYHRTSMNTQHRNEQTRAARKSAPIIATGGKTRRDVSANDFISTGDSTTNSAIQRSRWVANVALEDGRTKKRGRGLPTGGEIWRRTDSLK